MTELHSIMNEDFTAITTVGVKIHKNDFHYKPEAQRGCDHPEQGSKYCPECGAIMWKPSERTCVLPCPNFEDPTWPTQVVDADNHKYSIVNPSDSDFVIVTVNIVESQDYSGDPVRLPPAVRGSKNKLRNFLGAYGLWNEDNFGTWCILERH